MSVLLPPPIAGNPGPTYNTIPAGVVGACSAFIAGALVSLGEELRAECGDEGDVFNAASCGGLDFWIAARADELRGCGVDQPALVRALLRAGLRVVAPRVPGAETFIGWALERVIKGWSTDEALQAARGGLRDLRGEPVGSPWVTWVGVVSEPWFGNDHAPGFELRNIVRLYVAMMDSAGLDGAERARVLGELARTFDDIATPRAAAPSRSERPIALVPTPRARLWLATDGREAELEELRGLAIRAGETSQGARSGVPLRSALWSASSARLVEALGAEHGIDGRMLATLQGLECIDFELAARVGREVDEHPRALGRAFVLVAFVAAQSADEERRAMMERIALRGFDLVSGAIDESTFERDLDALMRIGEGWAAAFVDVASGRAADVAVHFARDLVEDLSDEAARWALTVGCDVLDALATGDEPAVDPLGVFLMTGGAA